MDKIKGITIGIGVVNSKETVKWYKDLLGDINVTEPVPGLFELILTETVCLQFDDTGYLKYGGDSVIIRFETTDIEQAHELAKKLTQDVEGIITVDGVVKYFDFKDPSGNRLSFVEII